jgi:hypothetical protein
MKHIGKMRWGILTSVRTKQSSDYSVIVVVSWLNKQVLRDTPKWVPSSWKCLVLEEMVLQA